jgi:hypothetical protein
MMGTSSPWSRATKKGGFMKLAVIFAHALTVTGIQAQQIASSDTSQAHAAATQIGAQTHDIGPPEAIAQLKKLATAYNLATAKKDQSSLLRFYYSRNVPAIGAVSSPSFARMAAASNGRAPKIFPSNAKDQSTADTSASATAEKVTNLIIHTDGTVASLEYDYKIPRGYGHAFWTLVDTKDAWKITSIVYSINIRPTSQ